MNHSGKNIFHYACINGNIPLVKFLAKELNKDEIDFNAKDDCGNTAFVLACEAGSKNVVKLIRKYSRAKGFEMPTNLYWVHNDIIDLLVHHYKTNE